MLIQEAIGIAGAIPGIWKDVISLRAAWANRNDFLYAIDFETRLNLDLIAAIKAGGLTGTNSAASPAFAELMNSFETTATLALLAGSDRQDYRTLKKLLEKHWKWTESDFAQDEEKDKVKKPENVLDAFSFSVRKIEALKRIARIAGSEADFLKNLKLEVRINNINKALCTIRNCLKLVIAEEEQGAKKKLVKGKR